MRTEKFLNQEYQLIENYKDAFDKDAVEHLFTEYFLDYDYVVGDWSYGKLRLKGFCKKENSRYNERNDIQKKEEYFQKYCAYNCGYFILERKHNG
ncbi:MAG: YutD family protein [Firmicutes bacterium]|nr:YutD family protein [Bacillota bacterium]